jgi:hypothetical protein
MHTAGLPASRSAGIIAGMLDLILLVAAWATIATILLALVAVYNAFGMAALYAGVFLLYLLHLALQCRSSGYFDPGGAFGGGPKLPPPGTRALRGPGPPQIGRSRRPALPGPKK